MSEQIEASVVLPCLNEEKAIGVCIRKIQEVFKEQGIRGEIIVADNGSTDSSREIASGLGAKVFIEQQRGYGAAYLRGLREALGRFIVMGDSDNSYDFYEIPKFLEPLKKGYDFVLGSRFKGKIKKGAMPWMNRYIGNPILSGMCRLFFKTKLSDIHCGMRSFTKEAFEKMKLKSTGMEFATEMVFSALLNNLKIYEIPIEYFPRHGASKLSPLYDAWRHIRFMLLYCPFWLYFIPGVCGFLLGLVILFILLPGPVLFLGHNWDMHFMIFSSVLSILSYQILNLGIYAHTFAINQKLIRLDKFFVFFQRSFNLERGLLLGFIVFMAGLTINVLIFIEWFSNNFGALYRIRESILAMTLLVIGIQTIFSSFFISLLSLKTK
ncbi:MAG: glycosyltransferase family 2 protein [Candidatus Omnitrophota bacterium]|nr:MAG: glycosyltransferase family 2 protein [Candidatus Omnitrophota bacterium]